jgi:hypothetical protein
MPNTPRKPPKAGTATVKDGDLVINGPDGRAWTWEQLESWFIALSIRNALEMFHGGGAMDPDNPGSKEGFISDRQMKALNIVIRRTVSKAVAKLNHPSDHLEELYWQLHGIHRYMEPPGSDELERAYEAIQQGRFDPPGFIPDCTRSEPGD